MTSESPKPPLRLTIEGLRWLGEDFESTGETPATLDLMDTDSADSEAGQIHDLMWTMLVRHAVLALEGVGVLWNALDFTAPNRPTETDIEGVVERTERALGAMRALKQLAPEVIEGDDDEGDEGDDPPEPAPEPGPSIGTQSEPAQRQDQERSDA
jgi:hypothetical protein